MLPALSLTAIDQLIRVGVSTPPGKYAEVLGGLFYTGTGNFFLYYLVHATLTGAALALLDIPQFVWRWWKVRRAVTTREIEIANTVCCRVLIVCPYAL